MSMHWSEAWLRSLLRRSTATTTPADIEDDETLNDLISQEAVMVGATAVIGTAAVVGFLKLISTILQSYGTKIGGITGP
jgi:hypothetical protein